MAFNGSCCLLAMSKCIAPPSFAQQPTYNGSNKIRNLAKVIASGRPEIAIIGGQESFAPVDTKGLGKTRGEALLPITRARSAGKRNCFPHWDTQEILSYRVFPWIDTIHGTMGRMRSKDMARETHSFSPAQSEFFRSMLRL